MKKLIKKNLLVLTILLFATGIRFYNFPNRVTFWSEQARSLIVAADYLKKPSLLGQSYFVRQDSNSHVMYAGALFNYSLIPLILMSGHNPIIITVFFTLLNLMTGLAIYLVVKKIFNKKIALLSCFLFLFNDYMIYHSLFIWIYNLLPLVGILTLYFIWRYFKEKKSVNILILGLLGGIGISLQFLFLPIPLGIFAILFYRSKRKIIDSILYVFGIFLGNLPMILFDLRHNFYNSRTLFQYFLDTLMGRSNASVAYYYFLPFWPILAIAGGFVIFMLWNKSKILSVTFLILYLVLNLISIRINWKAPTGMPEGLRVSDIALASNKISKDSNNDFNVAEVLDFDKRAYVLRYYLQFKDNKNPQGVADYPNTKLLYVLSETGYNFVTSDVWEVKSMGPTKISKLTDVGSGYAIYKLEK